MNERKIFLAAKFSVKFYARYNVGFPKLSRGRGEGLNPHPVASGFDFMPLYYCPARCLSENKEPAGLQEIE